MRLRPYIHEIDYETVAGWADDERTYALWCARLVPYPLQKESFGKFLDDIAVRFGDAPFVALDDTGEAVGFFCYSLDNATEMGMLKFVITDSRKRGRGIGRNMISLAGKYAFEISKAKAVRLNVFSVNDAARRCYAAAGFREIWLEENAFVFGDESWGRCSMILERK